MEAKCNRITSGVAISGVSPVLTLGLGERLR